MEGSRNDNGLPNECFYFKEVVGMFIKEKRRNSLFLQYLFKSIVSSLFLFFHLILDKFLNIQQRDFPKEAFLKEK